MMRKYFGETNGYNFVIIVDSDDMCYFIDEKFFDEPLTFNVAETTDYSNFDDCENIYEYVKTIGTHEAFNNIFPFSDFDRDDVKLTRFDVRYMTAEEIVKLINQGREYRWIKTK